MPRVVKKIFKKLLRQAGSKEVLPPSGHVVTSVITEEAEKAFYKPVILKAPVGNNTATTSKPDDVVVDPSYPELLAREAVVTSMLGRYTYGPRIDINHLVYDDQDNVCGTISYLLDGFTPFSKVGDAPSNFLKKLQGSPTPELLLASGITKQSVYNWRTKEDDAHPDNLSVVLIELSQESQKAIKTNGIKTITLGQSQYEIEPSNLITIGDITYGAVAVKIDEDMSQYDKTYILKGLRALHGVTIPKPKEGLRLKKEDLDECLTNLNCTYNPFNLQLDSYFSDLPKSYNRDKRFAAYESFKALLMDDKYFEQYQYQYYEALLEQILVYNPQEIRERLVEEFGDALLDYNNPDKLSADKISQLETEYPKYFTPEKAKRSYVDHKAEMLQDDYDELYRLVVYYTGFKNGQINKDGVAQVNKIGRNLLSFSEFLSKHPEAYHRIIARLEERNKVAPGSYDVTYIKKRYEKIWRDAHMPNLLEVGKQLESIIDSLALEHKIELPAGKKLELSDEHYKDSGPLIALMRRNYPTVAGDGHAGEAYQRLIACYNEFHDALVAYSAVPLDAFNGKGVANLKFIMALNSIMINLTGEESSEVLSPVSDLLAPAPSWIIGTGNLIARLASLTKAFNYKFHIETDRATQLAYDISVVLLPYTDDKIVLPCFDFIKKTVDTLESTIFEKTILEAIVKYKATGWLHSRAYIENYLKWSTASNSQKLSFILAQGGCESTSLNSFIVQSLFGTCEKAFKESGGYTFQPVAQALLQPQTFAFGVYATKWQEVAKSDADKGDVVCRLLFDFVDKFPKNYFRELVTTAENKYVADSPKSKYTFGLWQPARSSEVATYINNNYSNSHILALILCKGESSSTLSRIALTGILTAGKAFYEVNKIKLLEKDARYSIFANIDVSPEFIDQFKEHPHVKAQAKLYSVPNITPKTENKTTSPTPS